MNWPNFRKILDNYPLYRSCSPDLIDLSVVSHYVRQYNLHTLIDLRLNKIIHTNTRVLEGAIQRYINLPLQEERDEFKVKRYPTDEDYIKYYQDIIQNSQDNIMKVLSAVEDGLSMRRSMLIYCHAGKDRTGIIAWLVQVLMGYSKDEILASYQESSNQLLAYADIFQSNWEKRGMSKAEYLPRLAVSKNILANVMKKMQATRNLPKAFNQFNFTALRSR